MLLLINCLCVGAGGFIGSIFRYLMSFMPVGGESDFPFTTLCVNVIGALAIGFITAYFARCFTDDHQLLLFLRVGLCGGFTTFSAFTLENLRLFQDGEIFMAGIYISLSIILCLGAAVVGELMAQWILSVQQ